MSGTHHIRSNTKLRRVVRLTMAVKPSCAELYGFTIVDFAEVSPSGRHENRSYVELR